MNCKICHKPIERSIEGELICADCWTTSQQDPESRAFDALMEWYETHCADCEKPTARAVLQVRDGFCASCAQEHAQALFDIKHPDLLIEVRAPSDDALAAFNTAFLALIATADDTLHVSIDETDDVGASDYIVYNYADVSSVFSRDLASFLERHDAIVEHVRRCSKDMIVDTFEKSE